MTRTPGSRSLGSSPCRRRCVSVRVSTTSAPPRAAATVSSGVSRRTPRRLSTSSSSTVTRTSLAGRGEDDGMEVLSSRVLVRPSDPARSRAFYRDVLGLAVYREFGPRNDPGLVFFLGNGLLEVPGRGDGPPRGLALWLEVRDAAVEVERLRVAGVPVLQEARTEPWGLVEAWLADPDGVRIVLVEVPADHPLRRDQR